MKFIKWFAIFSLPFLIAIFVIRYANGYRGLPSMPTILSVLSRIEFHGFTEFTSTLNVAKRLLTSFTATDWSEVSGFIEFVIAALTNLVNFFVGIRLVVIAFLKLIIFTIGDIVQVLIAVWNIITLPSEAVLPI